MKNITKLLTVALSLLLCTACAASNTSTSKTQSHHPKQTKLTDKQKEEPKNKEAADQEMHPQGAVDLTKYKAKPVKDYGKKIDVGDGKKMNIYETGQGKIPIVFIPGQAEISPRYAYKNLIERLSKKYKIYTVEPLGYGLSDIPTKPRTLENITKEIHTGLNKIGVKNFYLAAHSLGGMYSLNYAKNYPEEVRGFIGMDTSTPWMEGEQKTKYDPESAKWAMKLPDVDDKTNEQYLSIAKKINGNKSQRDEDERLGDNLGKLKNVKFPKGMPTKYFLADQSVEGIKLRQADFKGLKNWDQQHIDLSEDPKDASVEILKGSHNIFQTQYEHMAKAIDGFIQSHQK